MAHLTARSTAVKNGDRFYVGKKCPHGHDGTRYVATRQCRDCDRAKTKRRYDAVVKYTGAETMRKWREKNKQRNLETGRRYAVRHRAKRNADGLLRKKKHAAKYGALQMKRYTAGKLRRPTWADDKKIEQFYDVATKMTKQTGVRHHVDHVIPLQGRLVSGLHVHENLQVITAKENIRKLNRFEPV